MHIIKQITLTHVPLSLITAQILQLQLTRPKYTYIHINKKVFNKKAKYDMVDQRQHKSQSQGKVQMPPI